MNAAEVLRRFEKRLDHIKGQLEKVRSKPMPQWGRDRINESIELVVAALDNSHDCQHLVEKARDLCQEVADRGRCHKKAESWLDTAIKDLQRPVPLIQLPKDLTFDLPREGEHLPRSNAESSSQVVAFVNNNNNTNNLKATQNSPRRSQVIAVSVVMAITAIASAAGALGWHPLENFRAFFIGSSESDPSNSSPAHGELPESRPTAN